MPCEHGTGEEGPETDSCVRGVEEGSCLTCESDCEDDGVSGLVGCKAAEVRIGDGVLDADGEGQEEQLGFHEGIDAEVDEPVLFESIPRE
jgi:hypothetical protein